METKFQVFISSTYEDLKEERKEVQKILLTANCIPAGMEAFVATDNDQFSVIKKVIDLCDYYVLIIGKRYGSLNSETKKSYTEMEYDYAKSKNIPVLVFAIDDRVEVDISKIEQDPESLQKLSRFRQKAMRNTLASIWNSVSDLSGKVAISIMNAKNELKRPGWIRNVGYNPIESILEIDSLKKKIAVFEKENRLLKNQIEDLLTNDTDLAFDDFEIYLYYVYTDSLFKSSKKTTLSEIFKNISIKTQHNRITKKTFEEYLKDFIDCSNEIHLVDSFLVDTLLNQYVNLKLMTNYVSSENNTNYYSLTPKGHQIKNKLNLFLKKE